MALLAPAAAPPPGVITRDQAKDFDEEIAHQINSYRETTIKFEDDLERQRLPITPRLRRGFDLMMNTLLRKLWKLRYDFAEANNVFVSGENRGPPGAQSSVGGFQPITDEKFAEFEGRFGNLMRKIDSTNWANRREVSRIYWRLFPAPPGSPPPGGSGKPRRLPRYLRGGARTTAAALLDVARNPTASLDELKSLFTHVASIFSDMGNLGAGLRTHGKEITRIVIKYLPIAGAPGFAAATAIEKLPIDKLIEVAASIVDFFTGKGDILTMLKAMGEVIGDIWNQLKDIIPKILEKVGAAVQEVVAKIGHEGAKAIGSSNELSAVANIFGANYESPAVREAREEYEREKARSAAAGAEKDRQNLIRQAAQDKEKADYLAQQIAKEGEAAKGAKTLKAATLPRLLNQAVQDDLFPSIGFTPSEAAGYVSGVPQLTYDKIAPVTKKDLELIKAYKARKVAEFVKQGTADADAITTFGPAPTEQAYTKLVEDARKSRVDKDALWEMANDSQLKAKAYSGDQAAQNLILKYYSFILNPDVNRGGDPGEPRIQGGPPIGTYTQTGLSYLANKGVRMAKEATTPLSPEDKERLARNKATIADGDPLSLEETAWTKKTEGGGGGYDPRDTANQTYRYDINAGDTYDARPAGAANAPPAAASQTGLTGGGRNSPDNIEETVTRTNKRVRSSALDPFFFDDEEELDVSGDTVLGTLMIDGVKFTATVSDYEPPFDEDEESGAESPLQGSGVPEDNAIFKRIAAEAYKSDPAPAVGSFQLFASSPTLKFYGDGPDVIVGIRGTDDFKDAKADVAIAFGALENSQRFKSDLAFMQKVKSENPDKVFYGAGHSLGGAILDLFISKGLIRSGKSINAALQLGKEETANERIYNSGDALYKLSRPFLSQNPLVESRTKSLLARLSPLYNLLEQHGISGYGKPKKEPRRLQIASPSSSSSSSSSALGAVDQPDAFEAYKRSVQEEQQSRIKRILEYQPSSIQYDESRDSIADFLQRDIDRKDVKDQALRSQIMRGAFPVPPQKLPKIYKEQKVDAKGQPITSGGFPLASWEVEVQPKRARIFEGPPSMTFDRPYEDLEWLRGVPRDNPAGKIKTFELFSEKDFPEGSGKRAYAYTIVHLDDPIRRHAYIALFEAVPKGLGLGSYLYRDVVEKWLQKKGFEKITLSPADKDAAAFWTAMGYKPTRKNSPKYFKTL